MVTKALHDTRFRSLPYMDVQELHVYKKEFLADSNHSKNTAATELLHYFYDFCRRLIDTDSRSAESTEMDTRTSAQLFAEALESYSAPSEIQQGAVLIYGQLSTYLQRTDGMDECESLLGAVNTTRVKPRLLLALLMGTSQFPQDKLPSRSALLRETKARYRQELPQSEVEAIFKHVK